MKMRYAESVQSLLLSAIALAFVDLPAGAQMSGNSIDASTIHGKVMCGYQGWFRCPGDPAGMGWIHWSGDPKRIAPETLTF